MSKPYEELAQLVWELYQAMTADEAVRAGLSAQEMAALFNGEARLTLSEGRRRGFVGSLAQWKKEIGKHETPNQAQVQHLNYHNRGNKARAQWYITVAVILCPWCKNGGPHTNRRISKVGEKYITCPSCGAIYRLPTSLLAAIEKPESPAKDGD